MLGKEQRVPFLHFEGMKELSAKHFSMLWAILWQCEQTEPLNALLLLMLMV